jgi:hypothetical protein
MSLPLDKKFIEVHKQDIVTEIHEQPVVEIHGLFHCSHS